MIYFWFAEIGINAARAMAAMACFSILRQFTKRYKNGNDGARAQELAKRALETRKVSPKLQLEPYSVLIYCTTHQQLDRRMRSKYSRLIRYAERLGVEPGTSQV
jgi:hypothetical protein